MRFFYLLAGMLAAALLVGVAAQSQPAVDITRVPQWYDPATGTTHLVSSLYPLPLRSPAEIHTTLPGIPLTSGVAQVVIPAGEITNGCDITFGNSYGDYFLAWTDPGAPTIPTAAAPSGFGSVPVGTAGRGIHIQLNSGINDTQGYVYHCPGPSAQGVSVVYIGSLNGGSTPVAPIGLISVDIY